MKIKFITHMRLGWFVAKVTDGYDPFLSYRDLYLSEENLITLGIEAEADKRVVGCEFDVDGNMLKEILK